LAHRQRQAAWGLRVEEQVAAVIRKIPKLSIDEIAGNLLQIVDRTPLNT
jgi:hypothetical protein